MQALIFSFLLISNVALGHARLRVSLADGAVPRLTPRNNSDANKGGTSTDDVPCGTINPTRGSNPVVLTVGENITVDIEETIDHTGTFQLNFSPAGQVNFIPLITPLEDPTNPVVNGEPNRYQAQFTVPDTPCTDCTIQFVQVMGVEPNASYYKSCVDIIITTAEAPPPAPPAGFSVQK